MYQAEFRTLLSNEPEGEERKMSGKLAGLTLIASVAVSVAASIRQMTRAFKGMGEDLQIA